MTKAALFENLPEFPTALSDDELRLLATLPDWETVVEIEDKDAATARLLARRGLIKLHHWKHDPIAIFRY